MTKKILILGVNGFIGSNLTKRILKTTNWEIFGMDLSANKIAAYLDNSNFNFTKGNVLQEKNWIEEHVQKCDVILPLVAIATPQTYVKDPVQVFELDFESNLSVVRQCVKYKKRIVFPSTSEVYGMCEDAEFNEETSSLVQGPICKERWIYSCSKQLLDRVIYGLGVRDKLDFTLFRPFNWIGPMQDDVHAKDNSSRVVTQFISNIIYTRDFQLVDGGMQRRCFTYIDDGIDALMRIIKNENNSASGKIINIGNPYNNANIKQIAEKIIALTQNYPKYKDNIAKIKIVNTDAKQYYGENYQDVTLRVPSIKNAKKYLNWQPTTDLDTALKLTLDFYLK